MIEVTFKLDIQEYTKLILMLLYTQIKVIFATLIGLFILILSVIDFVFSLNLFDIYYDAYFFSIGFFIVCIYPLWMRYRIKRTFKSNKKQGEALTYSFDETKYRAVGESFSSEIAWHSLYEVFESKKYFMLYHSRQTITIIPKRFFQFGEIKQLRAIIEATSGVRKRLMKS